MEQQSQGLRPVQWATAFFGFENDAVTYRYARQSLIPSVRVGRHVLFHPGKCQEYVDQGGRGLDEVER